MSGAIRRENDFWPEHAAPVVQPVIHTSSGTSLRNLLFGVRTETRVGSLLAAVGAIMLAKSGTEHISNLAAFSFPPGPLEICGLGVLVWLHAKWRHATRI
jgi:hypothetical protein